MSTTTDANQVQRVGVSDLGDAADAVRDAHHDYGEAYGRDRELTRAGDHMTVVDAHLDDLIVRADGIEAAATTFLVSRTRENEVALHLALLPWTVEDQQ